MKGLFRYVICWFLVLSFFAVTDTTHVQADEGAGYTIAVPFQYDFVSEFSEGLAAVKKGEKYGYIDKTGAVVIDFKYYAANSFKEGLASVRTLDAKGWHYIDKTGKTVIDNLPLTNVYSLAGDFSEGLAPISDGIRNPLGYIDKTGKLVIDKLDERIDLIDSFSEGLVLVIDIQGTKNIYSETDLKIGFIDKTGKTIIDYGLVSSTDSGFSDGLLPVRKNEKFGYIDKTGKLVIDYQFDQASSFHEGLATVRKGNLFGYIDTTGKVVIPFQFEEACDFSEGLAFVTEYVEIDGERSGVGDGGFIDKTGKIVIPYQFDLSGGFHEGYAAVYDSDFSSYPIRKWAFIDKTGKYVTDYVFELENLPERITEGLLIMKGENGKYGFVALKGDYIVRAPSENYRPPVEKATATPSSSSTIFVDGKQIPLEAYNVNRGDYFKIRDFAQILNGTEKQFDVSWDSKTNMVKLLSNKPYTASGGELAKGDGKNKQAVLSGTAIMRDGTEIQAVSYKINNNTYLSIRTMAVLLNIALEYQVEGKNVTYKLDTTKPYGISINDITP